MPTQFDTKSRQRTCCHDWQTHETTNNDGNLFFFSKVAQATWTNPANTSRVTSNNTPTTEASHYKSTQFANMDHLGSDAWLDANEIDEESELHTRATTFVAAIKWEKLKTLASGIRGMECELSDKYSLGHYNLVKRLTFVDGVSWIVRLRLPQLPSVFGAREAMKAADCMGIEIATMNYIRLNSDIPVPEVFGYDLSAENTVGAPYIFIEYLHGTVAAELQQAKECGTGTFGSPEQDRRFWTQMAEYHVQLASLTFDKIGSIHQNGDKFIIGPEIETGEGPWDTSQQYYEALVRHKMQVASTDAPPEVRESESFSFPSKFMELMESTQPVDAPNTRKFGLANRDFGAHNVLVDGEFNIVGFIDFDGVIAAPSAVVAQLPELMDLSCPVPGFVETREMALEYQKKVAHLLPRYIDLVQAAVARREINAGKKVASEFADLLASDAASIVQGLNEYGQHRDFINDRWSAAYDLLLQKYREEASTAEMS